MSAIRNYALVTGAYWAFTLTDGALRMLVLLHFHELGYTPVQLAFLFLFYEFFGDRHEPRRRLARIPHRSARARCCRRSRACRSSALTMLSFVDPAWSKAASVVYVMAAQALSGIAKDLTKMSSKSSHQGASCRRTASRRSSSGWRSSPARRTRSKASGFFLGGVLLAALGFRAFALGDGGVLVLVLLGSRALAARRARQGQERSRSSGSSSRRRARSTSSRPRASSSSVRATSGSSSACPSSSRSSSDWGFTEVGGFLALWVIGYGVVQSVAPA